MKRQKIDKDNKLLSGAQTRLDVFTRQRQKNRLVDNSYSRLQRACKQKRLQKLKRPEQEIINEHKDLMPSNGEPTLMKQEIFEHKVELECSAQNYDKTHLFGVKREHKECCFCETEPTVDSENELDENDQYYLEDQKDKVKLIGQDISNQIERPFSKQHLSMLDDNEIFHQRVQHYLRDVNEGRGLPAYDFIGFFGELLASRLSVEGTIKLSPSALAKMFRSKKAKIFDRIQEFTYQAAKLKPKAPFVLSQLDETAFQFPKKYMIKACALEEDPGVSAQSTSSRLKLDKRDVNGIILDVDEMMEGLHCEDFGITLNFNQYELVIRCSECLNQNKITTAFQNYWQLEKHMRDTHDHYTCFRCEEVFSTKYQLKVHRAQGHPKPKKLYRCRSCKKCEFRTIKQLNIHIQQSPNGECKAACPAEGCQLKFLDDVEAAHHYSLCHPLVSQRDLTIRPLGSMKMKKWRNKDEVNYHTCDVEGLYDIQLPGLSAIRDSHPKDDTILILYKNTAAGLCRLRKQYKDQRSIAVINEMKLPGIDRRELGYAMDLILTWLDNQNIGTVFVYSLPNQIKFWRHFRFFQVTDKNLLSKANNIRPIKESEKVLSIRTKHFFQNQPHPISWPENLPVTPLSSFLRQFQQAVRSTGVYEIIKQSAIDKCNESPIESGASAQKSDQEQTLPVVIEYVSEKVQIHKQILNDLHRFRPDWTDGVHYNNLKQKYGFEVNLSNQPYTLSQANNQWNVVNWFNDKSIIEIVPDMSLDNHYSKSFISLIGIIKQVGALRFGNHNGGLQKPIDICFMLKPQHYEYIEYRLARRRDYYHNKGLQDKDLKPLEIDWSEEKLDIVLRNLVSSKDHQAAQAIAKVGHKFMAKITPNVLHQFRVQNALGINIK